MLTRIPILESALRSSAHSGSAFTLSGAEGRYPFPLSRRLSLPDVPAFGRSDVKTILLLS
jgi:hypothetical protein